MTTNPPDEYLCPILMVLMEDPVVGTDGHTYERTAIEEALAQNPRSPLTREPMQPHTLRSNYTLKSLIERFRGMATVKVQPQQQQPQQQQQQQPQQQQQQQQQQPPKQSKKKKVYPPNQEPLLPTTQSPPRPSPNSSSNYLMVLLIGLVGAALLIGLIVLVACS